MRDHDEYHIRPSNRGCRGQLVFAARRQADAWVRGKELARRDRTRAHIYFGLRDAIRDTVDYRAA